MRAESALSTLACNCSSSASLHRAEGETGSDITPGPPVHSYLCGNHSHPFQMRSCQRSSDIARQNSPGSKQLLVLLQLAALGFDSLAEGSHILLQLLYEAITLLQLI